MTRSRLIHPEFAQHEGLGELTHSARLLFALLPTLLDREGRVEDRPRRIKANLFPYDTDEQAPVDLLLGMLAEAGFVCRYEVDGERLLCIPSFSRWQKCHPREAASVLPPPPTESGASDKSGRTLERPGHKKAPVSTSVSTSVSVSTSDQKPEAVCGAVKHGIGCNSPANSPHTLSEEGIGRLGGEA